MEHKCEWTFHEGINLRLAQITPGMKTMVAFDHDRRVFLIFHVNLPVSNSHIHATNL